MRSIFNDPATHGGVRRIAIFGTESTGKTTLARKLAEHFRDAWAPEYVRQYWDEHNGQIGPADLDAIGRGQVQGEDAAAARARRVIFCDTELITCTLWDDVLFPGSCPAWVRAEAERRARSYAVWLLCDTDIPWAPDPQRCFPRPEDRARGRQMWRDALTHRGLEFVDIRGDWAEREARAIAAVEDVLRVKVI